MKELTPAEVVERCGASTTVDLLFAGRALGLGAWATYEAQRRGEFPVTVIKAARNRYRVPSAELLRALGLDQDG